MSVLEEPGDLAETPLAAILIEALNVRATGVLEVAHGGGTSRLWFRDGHPVGAQVFNGFKPLGMLLLREGLIDIDALSTSLALMAQTRRPQGEILVGMGAVGAEEVARALAEQQAGYFGAIAALDRGAFVFDGSTPLPEWTRASALSPVRTIVDALERPQAEALVRAALEPAAAGGVRLSAAYAGVAEAFRWTDAEVAFVARMERSAPLDAVLAPSAVSPGRARAIVAGLLLLGLAAPTSGAAEALSAAEASGGAEAAGAAEAAGPDARGASQPQHRRDASEARARRQRLLQHAMRNMGIGPFARPEDAPEPPAPAAAAAEPDPVPAASPASGATSDEARLREALLAAAPRAAERDLFARLAVPRTASREDVRQAFLALARRFHPDRFSSPALADLAPTARDFFAAVNEAYVVLSDDAKRAAHLARHGTPAPSGPARDDAQRGEACLRTRDYGRARGFFEAAVRADPRPEYQAALAWAIVADPSCAQRGRAKALAAEAMNDPACDRAFLVAGIVARDEGDDAAAERHLRAAVEANPRNADAARELRLVQARRRDPRRERP